MRNRTVRTLATIAGVLPLLTLVLPVHSFETEQFADEAVFLHTDGGLLVIEVVLAVLVVAAWITRPGRVWGVAALLVTAASGRLLFLLGHGVIMWDGEDAQGRPTGGSEMLGPDWGLVPMVLALLLLVIAAILALRGQSTHRTAVADPGSDTMTR